jgi:hypothetical protein
MIEIQHAQTGVIHRRLCKSRASTQLLKELSCISPPSDGIQRPMMPLTLTTPCSTAAVRATPGESIAKGDWKQDVRVDELAFEHAEKPLEVYSKEYRTACSVGLEVGVTALDYEESLLLRPTRYTSNTFWTEWK